MFENILDFICTRVRTAETAWTHYRSSNTVSPERRLVPINPVFYKTLCIELDTSYSAFIAIFLQSIIYSFIAIV